MASPSHTVLSFLAAFALTITFVLASPTTERVTLSTSLGDVTGTRETVGTGIPRVEVYYGIPFAKPPVGNLRFKSPEPAEPWGPESLDATVKPNACWQEIDVAFNRFSGVDMWNPNTNRSEDCLYLNVWRPETTSTFAGSGDDDGINTGHKSILVWIFGGGFWSGSATLDIYDASQLAARNDVIVVTIAYRVGPFGFLYLGDEGVSGNAGLLDQVMALQWVRENAVNLGGSPDDITLFGESAGAASVGFHLLSPLSRSLFNRAIMQSASPTADWAVISTKMARNRSVKLAESLSCSANQSATSLLSCLQTAHPANISYNQWILPGGKKELEMPLGPIVDGVFLPTHPKEMLRAGDVKITDVIMGVNKDEGIFFDLYYFWDKLPLNNGGRLSEDDFESIMVRLADNNTSFQDQLESTYASEGRRVDVVDAISGDHYFKCPVVDFARDYSALGGRVYVYSFDENLSSNPWPNWMGVPHGYEIGAIFGRPLAPHSNNTHAEKELSLDMMQMWTQFAKTGSPNNESSNNVWPMYTREQKEYVVIDANGLSIDYRLREDECQFWSNRRLSAQISQSIGDNQESPILINNLASFDDRVDSLSQRDEIIDRVVPL